MKDETPATGAGLASAEAEQRLRSTGEFVGAVTHALKGLLNGLEGGLYLAESGQRKGDQERVGRGLDMVKRNAARLRNMIGSALYYAKDREPDRQPLDLDQAVSAAAKAVALSAEPAGVEIEIRVEPATVAADPTAMNAILVDLLEQAIDACDAFQDGSKRVTLQIQAGEGGARIVISREGLLMDPQNLSRAVAPHYSPGGGDRSVLWAYAAGRAARMQGGTFQIDALPSGGMRFSVQLPAPEAEAR